jgi:hypothetical protein
MWKFTNNISQSDIENAFNRRVQGDIFEPIGGIDNKLNAILIKACSFDKDKRYNNISEFKKALLNIIDENDSTKNFDNNTNYSETVDIFNSSHSKIQIDSKKRNTNKNKKKLYIPIIFILLVGICLSIYLLFFNNSENKSNNNLLVDKTSTSTKSIENEKSIQPDNEDSNLTSDITNTPTSSPTPTKTDTTMQYGENLVAI